MVKKIVEHGLFRLPVRCSSLHSTRLAPVTFHVVKIMLWMSVSAASGEWPRQAAHSSFGMSLLFLPTRL